MKSVMGKILKTGAVAAALIFLTALVLFLSPSAQRMVMGLFGPDHDFDAKHAAAALNYGQASSWLAIPTRAGNADLQPASVSEQLQRKAAVFFIHPTAYLKNHHWTTHLNKNSATEQNKQWMLANQASAFNGCCEIWAPYFRESTVHVLMPSAGDNTAKALEFAYQDVLNAFDYFISQLPPGAPFIIASHSKGSIHGQRLLQQRIEGTRLFSRLVAAYLIGCTIPADIFTQHYQQIKACTSAGDLHCVNAFDTWRQGGQPSSVCPHWQGQQYQRSENQFLCVNPLSWQLNGERVEATENLGAVSVLGRYNLSPFGEDVAKKISFDALTAPLPRHTWAACENGVLYTGDQSEGAFSAIGSGDNYQAIDYALFYMNIRVNAQHRVRAWFAQNSQPPTE